MAIKRSVVKESTREVQVFLTDVSEVPDDDVFSGPVTLHSAIIDNSANTAGYCVNFIDALSPTISTDEPECSILLNGSAVGDPKHDGITFVEFNPGVGIRFETGLSVTCVGGGSLNIEDSTGPSNTVTVSLRGIMIEE